MGSYLFSKNSCVSVVLTENFMSIRRYGRANINVWYVKLCVMKEIKYNIPSGGWEDNTVLDSGGIYTGCLR